ncbi:MAG: MBL fold metallo-hydrolase [Spirochaetales bacterium]|uniref:MBL fold metallo-hydrolase n=1 Tax=Candidatus Thalassospirochaeta sargassi TaxID=3119039 RepID=A0AAJ1MIY6_9SPIO|nr:MBL fold metallo-hydrolase [Spirochaetales bacterium]
MKVKFWGVRGSTPCPGPDTVRIGGNTSCIELRYGNEDELIIIDAGSGIRLLGNHLMKTGTCPKKIKIFLTHTHSDHIMGLPYFTPIYIPGYEIDIYGPVTYEEEGLEKIISDQFSYRYFPVKHSELSATMSYHHLQQTEMTFGDLSVSTHYLNHPILTLGYRFEYDGKAISTAYDTEPFFNLFPEDPEDPSYDEFAAEEGKLAAQEANDEISAFVAGSDILIHDSQYIDEELQTSYRGWGHSSFEWTIKLAGENNIGKLLFFHHAMERCDDELETLLEGYRNNEAAAYPQMEIDLAREGIVEEC